MTYGAEVSPDLISRVTDAVLDEVREWQSRPLDAVYPTVIFDALRVKIRDEGLVENKAAYVALAYNSDGEKDVLGLWIEQTEGAKFWLRVVNELKARGVNDILIAVVDGLKSFPEAITSVYPFHRTPADATPAAAGNTSRGMRIRVCADVEGWKLIRYKVAIHIVRHDGECAFERLQAAIDELPRLYSEELICRDLLPGDRRPRDHSAAEAVDTGDRVTLLWQNGVRLWRE
ncbi:hypothetical protein ACVIYL_004536 [Bradyrhizobium sp. USDA 3315]